MGFSEQKAKQLWTSWCNLALKPSFPADGLESLGMQKAWWDFCTKELDTDEKEPLDDSDEEWERSLDAYGIKQELKGAIMDPDFSYLRLSPTCRHWIKDTMDIHYKWLQRRVFRNGGRWKGTQLYAKPKEGTRFSNGLESRPRDPGYITLSRAVDEDRIHQMFDEEGNLENLDQLRSSHASDFSGSAGCLYFTPRNSNWPNSTRDTRSVGHQALASESCL